MICRDARELLSALVDEQLTDAEEIAVRTHLERCEGCRAALEEMEATVSAVSSLPRVEVSGDFTARVMERVEAIEERRLRLPAWLRWEPRVLLPAPAMRMAAVLVLGVLVGYGWAHFRGGDGAVSPVAQEQLAAPAESSGSLSSPAAADARHAIPAGEEIDYVLDRYTLIQGQGAAAPGASRSTRPAVANQDVPVRF